MRVIFQNARERNGRHNGENYAIKLARCIEQIRTALIHQTPDGIYPKIELQVVCSYIIYRAIQSDHWMISGGKDLPEPFTLAGAQVVFSPQYHDDHADILIKSFNPFF